MWSTVKSTASVCLSVCHAYLPARISRKPQSRTSPIFCACCLCPSLSSDTVICYMYFRFCGWPCFRTIVSIARHVYYAYNSTTIPPRLKFCSSMKILLIVGCAPGRSLLSTIAFCYCYSCFHFYYLFICLLSIDNYDVIRRRCKIILFLFARRPTWPM